MTVAAVGPDPVELSDRRGVDDKTEPSAAPHR
jgi:hypothetical protein